MNTHYNSMLNPDVQEYEDVLTLEEIVEKMDLVIYNDDVNTFDHVISSLIKVCKHEPEQAEQCTYLIHLKGKCQVKHGDWETLEPMCTALLERGLTAEIR